MMKADIYIACHMHLYFRIEQRETLDPHPLEHVSKKHVGHLKNHAQQMPIIALYIKLYCPLLLKTINKPDNHTRQITQPKHRNTYDQHASPSPLPSPSPSPSPPSPSPLLPSPSAVIFKIDWNIAFQNWMLARPMLSLQTSGMHGLLSPDIWTSCWNEKPGVPVDTGMRSRCAPISWSEKRVCSNKLESRSGLLHNAGMMRSGFAPRSWNETWVRRKRLEPSMEVQSLLGSA